MPILGSQGSQLIRSFLQPLLAAINSVSKGGSLGSLVVSFVPANSGPAATSFTVTSSPGGITASGASSPLTVTGLTPGTSYSFTIVASNAVGSSAASAASSSLAASQYVCSVGSVSGSNCVFGAIGYTDYNCPPYLGLPMVSGCQTGGGLTMVQVNGINIGCPHGSGGQYLCCRSGDAGTYLPACTAYTAYYCQHGGSLSGSTCTIAASIG